MGFSDARGADAQSIGALPYRSGAGPDTQIDSLESPSKHKTS